VHRKVRKSEELVVGKGCATGNDSIFRVGNKTMTLFWVEVQAVVSIAQKENRNEVNGGVKNIEGLIKSERTKIGLQFNGPSCQLH
jgi:hypothetical protein